MKTARARATKKKHVILFLAANPSDPGRLALDREARSIHVELKRSGYRDRFDFVTRWAAEPLDLLRELRELKPTIVHFSGHGVSPDATTEPAPGGDTEIAELIGRLRAGEREIFVIGPSGSGKSSLVTAGVLPRLARGVAGMGPFVIRELRPGDLSVARPSEALEAPAGEPLVAAERVAGLLAHRASGASLLIVVDQLYPPSTTSTWYPS